MTDLVTRWESEKLTRDLDYLMTCLADMFHGVGEEKLAESLPWKSEGTVVIDDFRVVRAWSIAFQLRNMAEENLAVQRRRALETENGCAAAPGLWGEVLEQLKGLGLTEEKIAGELGRIRVEPVLTAHPTEAKRASVLRHLRELYLLLVKLENSLWAPAERHDIREEIVAMLERLWRTGEIYLEKVQVHDELAGIIYHLREIFPQVLPILDRRLRHAWRQAGLKGEPTDNSDHLPKIGFSTWVGGDRDGHPLVTPAVTEGTLNELRLNALTLVQGQLAALGRRLSITRRLLPPPPSLDRRMEELSAELGGRGPEVLALTPEQPWRQMVNLMKAKLPLDSAGPGKSSPAARGTATATPANWRATCGY